MGSWEWWWRRQSWDGGRGEGGGGGRGGGTGYAGNYISINHFRFFKEQVSLSQCRHFYHSVSRRSQETRDAPQGSTSLLPKLSVTSKVSAPTSCAWVESRVPFDVAGRNSGRIYFPGRP